MSGTQTKKRGPVERVRERLRGHPGAARWIAFAALGIALLAVLDVAGVFGSGGKDDGPPPPPARIADTTSSWIPGQASLATAPAYQQVAQRAEALGNERTDERAALIKRLAAKKKADLKRERDRARERFERLRRLALARYRAALKRNAADRAEAAKRRAAALAEYNKKLKEYRASLIIKPGEECKLASVRARYDCSSGLLPHEPLPGE